MIKKNQVNRNKLTHNLEAPDIFKMNNAVRKRIPELSHSKDEAPLELNMHVLRDEESTIIEIDRNSSGIKRLAKR